MGFDRFPWSKRNCISNKKHFDLNIDKILENWECKHALREIISNALDEQALTGTQEIEIYKDGDTWIIRDYGRGIKTEHLIQTENQEKLANPGLIGKFGIGLKDALATFDRHGIEVNITSKHASISIERAHKIGFDDIVTLHATIEAPCYQITGTEFKLRNLKDKDVEDAKNLFLKFNNGNLIEKNKFGEVYANDNNDAKIYINGVLVAEESNFLFNYNITNVDSILRKAINRERSNISRTAYASAIRRILLNCKSERIGELLGNDLALFSTGQNHDELRWIDIQSHAAKIMATKKDVVFVTSKEVKDHSDLVNEAYNKRAVVIIPDNLRRKIEEVNKTDNGENGVQITDLQTFIQKRSENFEYHFSDIKTFTDIERRNYNLIEPIFRLLGGKASVINRVLISENMQKDTTTFMQCSGVWDHSTGNIIILRKTLADRSEFLSVLLHEIAHANSGFTDATRGFESELSKMLGILASKLFQG